MIEEIKFRVIGDTPLLMHNEQLADTTNDWAIALAKISKQRNKTDAQLLEMKRIEWYGGLYVDQARVVVPAANVISATIGGAKKSKLGKDARAAIFEPIDCFYYPLEYDGPKQIDALWESQKFIDYRSVRVTTSRVSRCRPRFNVWAFDARLLVNTDVGISVDQVIESLHTAGFREGLMDYRPRFGRFHVEL